MTEQITQQESLRRGAPGGGGFTLFNPFAPDDIVRYGFPGEPYARIEFDPHNFEIRTGDGTAPPLSLTVGGGGGATSPEPAILSYPGEVQAGIGHARWPVTRNATISAVVVVADGISDRDNIFEILMGDALVPIFGSTPSHRPTILAGQTYAISSGPPDVTAAVAPTFFKLQVVQDGIATLLRDATVKVVLV